MYMTLKTTQKQKIPFGFWSTTKHSLLNNKIEKKKVNSKSRSIPSLYNTFSSFLIVQFCLYKTVYQFFFDISEYDKKMNL